MIAKRLVCMVCVMSLFLVSCSKNESKKSTESEKSTQESSLGSSDHEHTEISVYTMPDDYYVEWAVPDVVSILPENIAAFNNMLSENGYDFGLKLTTLSFEDYNSELNAISPDIAFIGFNDENVDISTEIISSGYFENLDSFLENSVIYSQISPELWDSVRFNGSIYTIPNCTAQDVGVSVVFDLDKVSKETAESFSGDISELNNILGDDGMLLYQLSGLDFVSYYGYEYKSGVLVSQKGEVLNPFECGHCIDWLKTINGLYIENKATDDVSKDWSVCITKDLERIEKENTYIYTEKAILGTRYSASTGILSSSGKKENAFKILELLHTDSDFANCLIYGTDFKEENGYAVNSDGEIIDGYINKLIFGLDENLLWSMDYLKKFDSYRDKIDYYNDNVIESPAMDIQIEFDTSEISEIMQKENELWKSGSLENDISKIKEELKNADIQQVISEFSDKLNGE